MIRIKGEYYRTLFKWGAYVSVFTITIYPIIIYPILNVDKYKDIQRETRRDIKQDEIQPGNMKVWSDPFDREFRKIPKV